MYTYTYTYTYRLCGNKIIILNTPFRNTNNASLLSSGTVGISETGGGCCVFLSLATCTLSGWGVMTRADPGGVGDTFTVGRWRGCTGAFGLFGPIVGWGGGADGGAVGLPTTCSVMTGTRTAGAGAIARSLDLIKNLAMRYVGLPNILDSRINRRNVGE